MKKGDDETSQIDALFQLAPPEFVSARNALAAAFKKAGRNDAAGAVKSLAKPSISAWTLNQLYWRHRAEFDRLIATGERFRQAQAARLAGRDTDIRGLLNERREVLSEMSRLAAGILQTSSGSAPTGVMRRITASLEALSAYGTLPGAPRAGRLTEDVPPPGFDALAALVPRVGDSAKSQEPSRILAFQKDAATAASKARPKSPEAREQRRKAQLAEAKTAKADAARALTDAKRAAEKAQAELKKSAARARDTEKDMVAAEERLQKLTALAQDARQRARKAAAEAESAAQAVDEAERTLEKTTRALEELE